jgi:hypothetical protein
MTDAEVKRTGFVERLNQAIDKPLSMDAAACTCVPITLVVTKRDDLSGNWAAAGDLVDGGLTPGGSNSGFHVSLYHENLACPLWQVAKATAHIAGRPLSQLEFGEQIVKGELAVPPDRVYRFSCSGCEQELLLQTWAHAALEIVSPTDKPVVPVPANMLILPLPESVKQTLDRRDLLCPQCRERSRS